MSAAAATLPLAALFGLPEACRYAPTLVVPVVVQSELSVTVAIRHIAIPSPCSVLAIVSYSGAVASIRWFVKIVPCESTLARKSKETVATLSVNIAAFCDCEPALMSTLIIRARCASVSPSWCATTNATCE